MFNKDRKEIYVFYDRKNIIKLYKEHAIFMEWEQKSGSILNKAIDRMFSSDTLGLEYDINEFISDMELTIIYRMQDAIVEINNEKLPDTNT